MLISFITPVFNNAATLEASVGSVLRQRTSHELEIIVVDDGSTDGSARIAADLAAQHDNVTLVALETNQGESAALNAGISEARGEYLAIAEGDVTLDENWLEAVLPAFHDPAVMGAGGYLKTPRTDSCIARIAGYEYEQKMESSTPLKYVNHVTSANAIYRREVFDRIGRFDENLVNAALDGDLNQRIACAGYRLVLVSGAVAGHHFKQGLWQYLRRQFSYARFRPYVGTMLLYPRDSDILIQLLLTMAVPLSLLLAFSPYYYWLPPFVVALLLLYQVPFTARMLRHYRDPAVLFYPFVIVLRNIVGLLGFFVGCWEWSERRRPIPEVGGEGRRALALVPLGAGDDGEQSLAGLVAARDTLGLDIAVVDYSGAESAESLRREGVLVLSTPVASTYATAMHVGFDYAVAHSYGAVLEVAPFMAWGREDLAGLLSTIRSNRADVAIGSRYTGVLFDRARFSRRLVVRLLAFAHTLISRQKLTDPASSLRAYNQRVLLFCTSPNYPTSFDHTNMTTVLAMAGFRLEETPVKGQGEPERSLKLGEVISYIRHAVVASILVGLRRRGVQGSAVTATDERGGAG